MVLDRNVFSSTLSCHSRLLSRPVPLFLHSLTYMSRSISSFLWVGTFKQVPGFTNMLSKRDRAPLNRHSTWRDNPLLSFAPSHSHLIIDTLICIWRKTIHTSTKPRVDRSYLCVHTLFGRAFCCRVPSNWLGRGGIVVVSVIWKTACERSSVFIEDVCYCPLDKKTLSL